LKQKIDFWDGLTKYLFLPGSTQGGGLGRHSKCLTLEYPHANIWDYNYRIKNFSMINSFVNKIRNRVMDCNFEKFNQVDLESSNYLINKKICPDVVLAFSGCSLNLFALSKKKGCKSLELESPTAHVGHCYEMNQIATKKLPVEKPWLSIILRDKMLAEYQIADRIWVNSDYSFQTFLERGIPRSKLARRYLSIDPRFQKPTNKNKNKNTTFNLIYVGSLTVTKGVPLLLEAYQELNLIDSCLVLVGGTGSSGMKRYVNTFNSYGNIIVCPGDPYPHLLDADLFVYPSWSDGYGLAPKEAMAMGVPVIVTENTGMKEEIKDQSQGAIFNTGDKNKMKELIMHYYSRWLNK
jgi:glycosyltransferase involved in cell wall biosynthesis